MFLHLGYYHGDKKNVDWAHEGCLDNGENGWDGRPLVDNEWEQGGPDDYAEREQNCVSLEIQLWEKKCKKVGATTSSGASVVPLATLVDCDFVRTIIGADCRRTSCCAVSHLNGTAQQDVRRQAAGPSVPPLRSSRGRVFRSGGSCAGMYAVPSR